MTRWFFKSQASKRYFWLKAISSSALFNDKFWKKKFFLSYFDSVYTVIVGAEVIVVPYLTQWHTILGRTPPDEGSARRMTSDNIHTHIRYPCPRWDSNPQSQPASGRRRMPSTARPQGSAFLKNTLLIWCRPNIHPDPLESLAFSHRLKQPIVINRRTGKIIRISTLLKLGAVNFF
jgi:hypothetical protein